MMVSNEDERSKSHPNPNARIRPQHYKFTVDEIRVLKECNRESFFQRCIPFSTVLGGLTYFAVKTGRITGNPKFGAFPKVGVAVIAGYILGKYSYHQKCSEKFMALPNSKIGQMLHARRAGIIEENLEPGLGPAMSLSPFGSVTDSYSDISQPNRDLDYENRTQAEGLDDSFRPSIDNPIEIHEEEMPPQQKHITTYDELRKKNREEYEQKKLSSFRELAKPVSTPTQNQSAKHTESVDDYKPPVGTKNKYGDTWG